MCALAAASPMQTTYGSGPSPGNRGAPSLPISSSAQGEETKTKATFTSSQKSKGHSPLHCQAFIHSVFATHRSSFIVKVKAAEIVSSDLYHLGFTMRFPRALHIREDLTIADCMTVTGMSSRFLLSSCCGGLRRTHHARSGTGEYSLRKEAQDGGR